MGKQADAKQSKKLNEVEPVEVLEAILGRKKKEFEEKYWDAAAGKEEEPVQLPTLRQTMEKISKICAENNMAFRRKRPLAVEGGKKGSNKKPGKEKVECRPRRWESSDEERGGPSQSNSEATCRATAKLCSPKFDNRGTRSTFDSSQAANSFLVEGLDRQNSFKVEGLSELHNEYNDAEWGGSFVWTTPAARKQSENFVSEGVAQTLLQRHQHSVVKSKSQKRSDPVVVRTCLESKTLTDHSFPARPAPFVKILNPRKDKMAPNPGPDRQLECVSPFEGPEGRLTELDELLIKCIHLHPPTTQRRRSRFNFCQGSSKSPAPARRAPVRDLVETLINPEEGDAEDSSTADAKSALATFVQQRLTYAKF